MSLEQAMQELTEALRENTAALTGGASSTEPKASASATPTKTAAKKAAPKDEEIPYADVQKAVANLANMPESEGKGKPAVKAILKQFGVTKADQVEPAKRGEIIAALNEKANAEAEEDLA